MNSTEAHRDSPHPDNRTPRVDPVRLARAKLIEETTYRLTDLFTLLCGRIEILGDKLSGPSREELLSLRVCLMKAAALNERLLLAARECRSEIGA